MNACFGLRFVYSQSMTLRGTLVSDIDASCAGGQRLRFQAPCVRRRFYLRQWGGDAQQCNQRKGGHKPDCPTARRLLRRCNDLSKVALKARLECGKHRRCRRESPLRAFFEGLHHDGLGPSGQLKPWLTFRGQLRTRSYVFGHDDDGIFVAVSRCTCHHLVQ